MKTFCLLWLFIFGSGAALAETAPVDDIEMPVVPLVDRVEAIGEVDEAPMGNPRWLYSAEQNPQY